MQSSFRLAVGSTALQHGVDVHDLLRVKGHAQKAADTIFSTRTMSLGGPWGQTITLT